MYVWARLFIIQTVVLQINPEWWAKMGDLKHMKKKTLQLKSHTCIHVQCISAVRNEFEMSSHTKNFRRDVMSEWNEIRWIGWYFLSITVPWILLYWRIMSGKFFAWNVKWIEIIFRRKLFSCWCGCLLMIKIFVEISWIWQNAIKIYGEYSHFLILSIAHTRL